MLLRHFNLELMATSLQIIFDGQDKIFVRDVEAPEDLDWLLPVAHMKAGRFSRLRIFNVVEKPHRNDQGEATQKQRIRHCPENVGDGFWAASIGFTVILGKRG